MNTVSSFFKDKDGRIVVWQWPNLPLYGWLVSIILAHALAVGQLKSGFELLAKAFIFTWAFLELTTGVNFFRRLLGVIVLTATIVGFFR